MSIFNKEGNFVRTWGSAGDGDGQFNGPAGLHIDGDDNLHIVDSRNHRVQKFTTDGKALGAWGGFGSGDGELDSPWGIAMDREGHVYVADHKNHRVQKFTQDGQYVAQFGSFGKGRGSFAIPPTSMWTQTATCTSAIGPTTGSRSTPLTAGS